MEKNDELKDLMDGELRRGRRPIDRTTRRQMQRVLLKFRQALETGDEEVFRQALLDLGQKPGSPEYARSLKIWREFHGAD